MSKAMLYLAQLLAAALALTTQRGFAQVREDADRLYGQGVHAYFAGNSSQAENCLSSALELNADDPRYYYFRAFALLRMGRTEEARGDMLIGAQLETGRPGRFAIGAALQRVQGADRLMLERFRREAQAAAGTMGDQSSRPHASPQSTTAEPDSGVLRHKLVYPLDQFLQPGGPQPVVDDRPPQRTFAPVAKPGGVSPPAAAQDDPFRDDPRPQPRVAPAPERAVNPAVPTTPPTVPAEERPAATTPPETPPADDDNPFGS